MKDFISTSFSGVTVKLALYVPINKGAAVHKNRPYHGFAMFFDSSRIYEFENFGRLETGQNEIVYMPKNSNYEVLAGSEPCTMGCYAINFEMDTEIDIAPFVFTPKNASEFLHAFKTAEHAWRTKIPGYLEKSCEMLYSIISRMKSEVTSTYVPKIKSEILAPAVKYITDNYTKEAISITDLSDMCGVSEVYFRKIFKNIYGTSPLKYINSLKLARAKELMLSGMYSVRDVAAMSGFFDDCYFSREFKKEFGVSPKEFK